jgi:uncharacterized protein DUF3810
MIYRPRIVLILLALVALFVPLPSGWVERVYSRKLYLGFQPYVTSVSNLSPVSLFDIFAVAALFTGMLMWARDWKAFGFRRAAIRCATRVITTAAVLYLLFFLSWGMNYRRVPLESKLDFSRARISADAVKSLAAISIQRLNAGYELAHGREVDLHALAQSFTDAQRLLGVERIAEPGRPKRSLTWPYFRYAAIDGMTVPVILEVLLNPDILPVEKPTVLAHEWAHLAGYADESEANFVAWIACVRSSDAVAQYSAWLDAYGVSTNVLSRRARAELPALDDGPRGDLRNITARYQRSSPVVRRAAREVYDSYLKANRIEEGIANYHVVLELILGTRFESGWKPVLLSDWAED